MDLAKELAITNCEFIQKTHTLELGTVHALMGEVGGRVGIPDGVLLIEPPVAVAWAPPPLKASPESLTPRYILTFSSIASSWIG